MRLEPAAVSAPVDVLSLEEIDNRYPDEWVLIEVTGLDEHKNVGWGRVLDHSPDRKRISKGVKRVWRVAPKTHIYVRLAGPRPHSIEELREALARAMDEDYVNAHW